MRFKNLQAIITPNTMCKLNVHIDNLIRTAVERRCFNWDDKTCAALMKEYGECYIFSININTFQNVARLNISIWQ